MMSLDGQFLFMPECRLFVAYILQAWWETKRNFGKCLLEVWNLLKYCTMKHCLQLWLNYILICFCIYQSCKKLPKFRLPHREELISSLWRHASPVLFLFLQYFLFSSFLFHSSYEGHLSLSAVSQDLFHSLIFSKSDKEGCHFLPLLYLFSAIFFWSSYKGDNTLKILNSSEAGGRGRAQPLRERHAHKTWPNGLEPSRSKMAEELPSTRASASHISIIVIS